MIKNIDVHFTSIMNSMKEDNVVTLRANQGEYFGLVTTDKGLIQRIQNLTSELKWEVEVVVKDETKNT